MKIRWLNNALRSLRTVHGYIALDNPAAAGRTLLRLEQAVKRLSDYPLSGRAGIVSGTRELVIAGLPYLIVYRVTDVEVQILRVFHTKQDSRLGQGPVHPRTVE
jgi:addiction module RelE/StbE family toxin